MRRSFALICLGLAVSGCSASTSRNAGDGPNMPTMITPLMLEPPPIYSILGFRDKIQLTSEQITSLDSIATQVHDQNVPLIRELREKASPTRNQIGMVIPDELRPALDSVRANNRAAATAVGKVLTPPQQQSACQIFEEQAQERENDRNRGNGPRPRTSRLGSEADSILASARRSVWPFCRSNGAVRR
jgi:hypothetical protein